MEITSEEVHSEVVKTEEPVCTVATATVSAPCQPSVSHGESSDNSKDSVSSCSEDITGPDSGQTGTVSNPVLGQVDVQISNTEVKSSVDTVESHEARTPTTSEQNMVCDQACNSAKANTSEPDSSDSVFVNNVEEIECDSGSSEVAAQSSVAGSDSVVSGVVDSTQCGSSRQSDNSRLVSSAEQSSQMENNRCDSCDSERRDWSDSTGQPEPSRRRDSSSSDSPVVPGPSNVIDKACTSSSSLLSSSISFNNVPNNHTSIHAVTSVHTAEKLSQVDSSTDKPRSRTNSLNCVTGSVLEPAVITNSTSTTSSSTLADNSSSYRSIIDNEVSNSVNIDNIQSNFTSTLPLQSLGESYSVTSNTSSSLDATPTQNRHLKFLNDSNYSIDMTVDSTTQLLPGASNVLNSGFPTVSNYDSDSMDVTSATEPCYGLGPDDGRRLSDDSLNSFPDTLSSTSSDSHHPKERKKVMEHIRFFKATL